MQVRITKNPRVAEVDFRKAIEKVQDTNTRVEPKHINEAIREMLSSPITLYTDNLSRQEKIALEAIKNEIIKSGVGEAKLLDIYREYCRLLVLDGIRESNFTQLQGYLSDFGIVGVVQCFDQIVKCLV